MLTDLTFLAGDVHKAAAQIKGQLPGSGVDAEKEGKKFGQEAGAKIDAAVSTQPNASVPYAMNDRLLLAMPTRGSFYYAFKFPPSLTQTFSQFASADKEFSKAKSEAEAYAKGAKADALKKIDEIDRKVEEGSAKAKGTISSWFGGK